MQDIRTLLTTWLPWCTTWRVRRLNKKRCMAQSVNWFWKDVLLRRVTRRWPLPQHSSTVTLPAVLLPALPAPALSVRTEYTYVPGTEKQIHCCTHEKKHT